MKSQERLSVKIKRYLNSAAVVEKSISFRILHIVRYSFSPEALYYRKKKNEEIDSQFWEVKITGN